MTTSAVRICVLYPEQLSLYGDAGNARILEHRCRWRGIDVTVDAVLVGDRVPEDRHVYLIGGGQDSDLRECAEALRDGTVGASLRAATTAGAVVMGVGGGFQLLGHSIELEGERLMGVGLLDVHTRRVPDAPRHVGPIAVQTSLDGNRRLVGFENHAGRIVLGDPATALGTVLAGGGNNDDDPFEGAVDGRVFGSNLHGPLLAKNAWLADWLLGLVVSPSELALLDDAHEQSLHEISLVRALGRTT